MFLCSWKKTTERQNGLWNGDNEMKLNNTDIEKIALFSLEKFLGSLTSRVEWVKPISIELFAEHQLGLKIEYTRLCDYGKVPGITVYDDIEIKLRQYLRDTTIKVSANTMLIDESLKKPLIPPDKEYCKRRFTIAYECSNHLLRQRFIIEMNRQNKPSPVKQVYTLAELLEMRKWHEWQANTMAAALLMPAKYLALFLGKRRFTQYGNRMNRPDKLAIANLSEKLKVSQIVLKNRLRNLGYITVMPKEAYCDPSDIEFDDEFHTYFDKCLDRV